MKQILIFFIQCYQKIPGNFHNHCKFIPTCSHYAMEAISEYGAIKGSFFAFKRILKCNPFHKGGIDFVPRRKNV